MRFKLDENLPLELADDLQRLGHEIDSVVAEGMGGAEDRTVLKAARTAERILLTLDKGIGDLRAISTPRARGRCVVPARDIRQESSFIVHSGTTLKSAGNATCWTANRYHQESYPRSLKEWPECL